ncbi:MAG: TerC family protein [Dehalococcoidia bacterium]
MDHSIWLWVGFTLFILAMLGLDLGVFHRRAHVVGLREAAIWSAVWITLALLFNGGVYLWIGSDEGLAFLTGYVIEKSLSVDNVFVWLVIFSYFAVPPQYQHRVLFWGILGAMVLRGIFIAAGVTLLNQFEWVIYLFGAFLVFTGLKLAFRKEEQIHPERNPVMRLVRRFFPVTSDYHGQRFFIRQHGRWIATPLLMVLVVVEATDVVFAADSIPAILAVTRDPFIVWSSNVFAILGLRALFFLVAGILRYFRYLNVGLAVVLCFVGVKMLISDVYHVPTSVSLGAIAGILGTTMLASYLITRRLVEAPAPKVGDATADPPLRKPEEPS